MEKILLNTSGISENGLFGFRVEFSLQCPRCDRPLPLDGPLEKAHCSSCQSDIDIPKSYWIETLANSCRKMQKTDRGMGTASMLMGTFQGNLTLARFDPYCDNCKTFFEDSWSLKHGTRYICLKCGMGYPVQKPPDWLTTEVPRIKTLINAVFNDGLPVGDSSGEKPESISCPSCSGQLEVDGTSRFVKCDYCGGQVYLPDALWLRFHGGKRKRRWFIISEYVNEE
jgi:DNA-directed RNA polymerase subunit RPC12/RpoP